MAQIDLVVGDDLGPLLVGQDRPGVEGKLAQDRPTEVRSDRLQARRDLTAAQPFGEVD